MMLCYLESLNELRTVGMDVVDVDVVKVAVVVVMVVV